MPISAWLTDIGNDLAYEVAVEQVVGWVEACLDRLLALGARVVLCDLPIDVLTTVSATRYRLFRTVLFPACRLDWSEMLRRAEQLSERLHALAESRNTPIFTGQSAWYGWDPIHPRQRYFPSLWREMLELVVAQPVDWDSRSESLLMRWYLRCLRPEHESFLWFPRRARQPNGLLRDGTEISLY
ncbi:MAG: hypothetical protein MI725_04110 [Pirellulales bacterium]|nr:hypothetical protein [Pirellulales bacterium]